MSDPTEDRFEAIEAFAEKQMSIWLCVREAAFRRDREALEFHCPQIRVLTLATFQAVKALSASLTDKGIGVE